SAAVLIPPQGGTLADKTSGVLSALEGTCGGSSSPEKVFQWTPAVSGTATIETPGSDYDTILYMRSESCAGGPEVACNDDVNDSDLTSSITPAVTAGTTYFIVVDGFGGEEGNFSLTVTPPSSATTTTASTSTTSTSTTSTTTS